MYYNIGSGNFCLWAVGYHDGLGEPQGVLLLCPILDILIVLDPVQQVQTKMGALLLLSLVIPESTLNYVGLLERFANVAQNSETGYGRRCGLLLALLFHLAKLYELPRDHNRDPYHFHDALLLLTCEVGGDAKI